MTMSLRLRITLVVVLVVTAIVAVVGQRVYAAAERELVEEVDIELQGRAAGFMTIVSGPRIREAFTRRQDRASFAGANLNRSQHTNNDPCCTLLDETSTFDEKNKWSSTAVHDGDLGSVDFD